MERLTEKHYLGTDHYMKCSGNCNVDMDCIDCPSFDRLVERLADYEDTGLTPAEVSALVKDWSDLCTAGGECGGYARLRGLAEADKDGRVVVLPCKVGDTLFRVLAGEILEHKVSNMRYLAIQGRWDIDTTPFCSYVESSIGKTIFLTREEAEKALESMRKDGAAW